MAQGPAQGLLFNKIFGQPGGGVEGLLGNPMLQVGMGLLAARHDGRINPFDAAMTGMANASQFRMLEQDRKREQEEQERQDRAREQAQKVIGDMYRTSVQMGPPTPDGQYNTEPGPVSPYGQALQTVAMESPYDALALAISPQNSATPADVQKFDYFTQVAQEDSERGRAARIALGLDPRATAQHPGYADQLKVIQGPDGRERMFWFSPENASVSVMADDGSGWIPIGGQTRNPPQASQPTPQPQQWNAPMLMDGQSGSSARPTAVVGPSRAKEDETAAVKDAEAAAEKRATAPKDVARLDAVMTRIDQVTPEIEKAIANTSNWSAGAGSLLSGVPMTDARDLAATLRTIKANIGFNELQTMRENSPTGGALGNVAIQELDALQAVLGSLDQGQSPEQLRENLGKIARHYNGWRAAVMASRAQAAERMDSPPPPPAPAQTDDDPLGIRK